MNAKKIIGMALVGYGLYRLMTDISKSRTQPTIDPTVEPDDVLINPQIQRRGRITTVSQLHVSV